MEELREAILKLIEKHENEAKKGAPVPGGWHSDFSYDSSYVIHREIVNELSELLSRYPE